LAVGSTCRLHIVLGCVRISLKSCHSFKQLNRDLVVCETHYWGGLSDCRSDLCTTATPNYDRKSELCLHKCLPQVYKLFLGLLLVCDYNQIAVCVRGSLVATVCMTLRAWTLSSVVVLQHLPRLRYCLLDRVHSILSMVEDSLILKSM
jgi:hypothetical protein